MLAQFWTRNAPLIVCDIPVFIFKTNLHDHRPILKLHKSVPNMDNKDKKKIIKSGDWHICSIWYNSIALCCMRLFLPLLLSTSSTRPLTSFVKKGLVHNPFDSNRRLLQSADQCRAPDRRGARTFFFSTCAAELLALPGCGFTGKSCWRKVLFLGVSSLPLLIGQYETVWRPDSGIVTRFGPK